MSHRYRHECPLDCKVFVGNLGPDADREQLESVFGRYGRVRNVWLATNPPGFAFIMFEESADAQTAVRRLNDTKICGRYVTVEMSTGKTRRNDRERDWERFDRQRDRDYGRYDASHRFDRFQSRGSRRESRHNRRHGKYSRSRSRSSTPQRHRGSGGDERFNSGRTLKNTMNSSRSRSRSRD